MVDIRTAILLLESSIKGIYDVSDKLKSAKDVILLLKKNKVLSAGDACFLDEDIDFILDHLDGCRADIANSKEYADNVDLNEGGK